MAYDEPGPDYSPPEVSWVDYGIGFLVAFALISVAGLALLLALKCGAWVAGLLVSLGGG